MEHELTDPQFDSFLGGSQKLPSGVNLSEFMKYRMEEVVMLTEAIKESPFRGQAFQRLPKHMRRRQMSHYIKRLPRRLQRPYLMSLKEAMPAPTKCPSRKYRRRPGNLLLEYNRRQKKSVWLETHIWHAKRFHMTEKWGYKLPEMPTNKSFKACYRAISEHCLLTDNSYYNCIELKGPEAELLTGLKQCNSPNCGLTFGAKMYLSGSREGSVTVFHPNSYPYRVIGNVTFMWEPVTSVTKGRTIWIWVHPLLHEEIVECFRELFKLSPENVANEGNHVEIERENIENLNEKKKRRKDRKSRKKIEQVKLEPKNVPFSRTPKFLNKDKSVIMTLLKDTLNRFQLIGPLSQAIVSQAFNVAMVSHCEGEDSNVEFVGVESKRRKIDDVEILSEEKLGKDTSEGNWWEEYYRRAAKREEWKDQKDFYKKLSECSLPNDAPPGMILSLIVEDPRLNIPTKREKATPQMKEVRQISDSSLHPNLSRSPIWDPKIRDVVSLNKLSVQEINEARSKKIVPGFDVRDGIPDQKQSRIPIMLVQRPGRRDSEMGKLGLGSGWDVITPAGFGMPIWLAFVFRGARTGGLRESELFHLECYNLNGFPQPDSVGGESEEEVKKHKLKEKYFRLPPNKRANFIKLGVVSPFYRPWKLLVRDWIPEAERLPLEKQRFSVLRDRKILQGLNEILAKVGKRQGIIDLEKCLRAGSDILIPVVVECSGKGKPQDFALICAPENKDLKKTSGESQEPTEPPHIDENKSLRKILRSEHSKLLKTLKRKRKRDRAKLKEDFAKDAPSKLKWSDILKSNSAPSESSSKEYNDKMESLWVPDVERINSLVNSCSRKIVGFVVKGDFSLSKAQGVALGYVTLRGLGEAVNICGKNKSMAVVLIRNRNSVQYRFGKLRIAFE